MSCERKAHGTLQRTKLQDFKELKVWQKAHQLVLRTYLVTQPFPKEEMYGLISQMRRSAASIPTNIAEGRGRGTDGELRRFMQIALGSCAELEYQLFLAKDLGYLDKTTHLTLDNELAEVRRMLIAFVQKL
jgi:four helix bundle protein